MDLADIPQVLEVDRESYSLPWPASAYRREVLHNRHARYLVLRELEAETDGSAENGEPGQRPRLPIPFFRWPHRVEELKPGRPGHIVGYSGMWIMMDEAHITTIALRVSWRGKGLGELLLASLIEIAAEIGIRRVTLEVRVSNEAAQNLYRKYGFTDEGTRTHYYSDNNEDALIMSTGNIQDAAYRRQFEQLVGALRRRLLSAADSTISAPAFPMSQNAQTVREAD